ncbi:MAG: hypothetical protein CL666_03970 [Balneola sp.]|nr:hypothetical protein [Balneola sp.]
MLGVLTQCKNVKTEIPDTEDLIPIELVAPVDKSTVETLETELVWKQIKGAKSYHLLLSESDKFDKTEMDTIVSATSIITSPLKPEITYNWKVLPIKNNKSGPWSEVWSFTAEMIDSISIDAVTLIAPADNADEVPTELEFKWAPLPEVSEYEYQLTVDSSFSEVITEETVSDNTYKPENLLHQKKYYWRVKDSQDTTGETWSEIWNFTTKPENTEATPSVTLIAPVNSADDVSIELEFKWELLPEASEYTYQLTEDNSFSSVIIEETVPGNSYKPENLLYQKTYYWRVKDSQDTTGETWSDVWNFTTEPENIETTTPVTLVTPINNADKVSTDLEFSWQPLSGISEYEYQLSDNSTFNSIITEDIVSGTTYKPNSLIYQKKYYWRVKSSGDNTGETWSEVWSFTTGTTDSDPGNSTTVKLLSPADNASGLSINPGFEWSELAGASEYEFQLADNSTFSSLIVGSIEFGTTYQANNLDYQTQYYWRVKGNGEGHEWSDPRSFMTMSEPNSPAPPSFGSFVEVHNSNFVVDGEILRFAGTNAYYLPNYEKLNPAVVTRALDLFRDTGISVIRMWGFYDGYDCGYSQNDANENVIQTAPGVYSESALQDLDNVIAQGKERGIGFIIPFINFWDELGGVCQYNTWAGASDPSTNMAFFMSNSDTQKWYKDYINMLLNRVNTVTGVAYKDEPAIVAWQIMNEGRNPGASATILRDWYQEIAQYIKSIDPNHLVSTGEEGFDEGTPSVYSVGEYSNTYTLRADVGSSYVMNTSIPEIDFGNAHWYPSEYGFGVEMDNDLLQAQRAWLSDHKKIAESSGKPFIIGEYGFPGWADERVSTMYSALYKHAEFIQLDGNLLWQLTADGTKCWEFGGNICYPAGREDTQLYLDFKNHVTNLRNLK